MKERRKELKLDKLKLNDKGEAIISLGRIMFGLIMIGVGVLNLLFDLNSKEEVILILLIFGGIVTIIGGLK